MAFQVSGQLCRRAGENFESRPHSLCGNKLDEAERCSIARETYSATDVIASMCSILRRLRSRVEQKDAICAGIEPVQPNLSRECRSEALKD